MSRVLLSVLLALFFLSSARAQGLLVSSRFTDEVLLYDGQSGALLRRFASTGGLDNPVGLTFGPDGHLYVASAETDQVLRYDGFSGAFLGVFAEGGGLSAPRNLNFGPDGDLYVANAGTDQVLRYDGTSGAPLGAFAGGNGLDGPTSLTFGPDGHLYVGSVLTDEVFRFDGATGDFLDVFASTGLRLPHDVAFGPDGHLYVSNALTGDVTRHDGSSGEWIDVFVQDPALSAPLGLTFAADGFLYVVNQGADEVRRYDAQSGAFAGVVVPPGEGGIDGPLFMAFLPERSGPRLLLPDPGTAGTDNDFALRGARPGAGVLWLISAQSGNGQVPGCAISSGLRSPRVLGSAIADESGDAVLRHFVPAGYAGTSFLAVGVDRGRCDLSPVLFYMFP